MLKVSCGVAKNKCSFLEDLLLDKKLDQFKELQWKVYAQIGVLNLQVDAYFRSINNFLNALDYIYVLFSKTPFELRKGYLLKDNKFVIRRNLFRIEKLINGEKLKKFIDINDPDYERCKYKIITKNNVEDFFDLIELQSILKNPRFYELALEHYDKVNQTKVKSIKQLIAKFTDNNIYNLNLLLQLVSRTTLASRGAIIDVDGYQVVTSVGINISDEKINRILDSISTPNKEIFSKGGLSNTRDFNREYLDRDIRAFICLPIYRENTDEEDKNFQKQNRKQSIRLQKDYRLPISRN